MIARFLSLVAVLLTCFVSSPTVIGQSKISKGEPGYFAHPTLFRIEFDSKKEEVATISSIAWPFRIREVETVKMKLDGTEIVIRKKVAKQEFRSVSIKSILPAYSFRDLDGKVLTEKQVRIRVKEGAVGIQHEDSTDADFPAVFRSVFKEDSFLMSWKPLDSLTDKQQVILEKHGTRIHNSVGFKSMDDEGHFHCPIFFEDISVEKDRLKTKSVSWKGKVDSPRKFDTVVGELLDFPGFISVPSVNESKQSFLLEGLEFRTSEGKPIDSSDATRLLSKPGAVAVFLPQSRELHPDWGKAVKKTVIVISKAPRRTEK